MKMSKNMYSDQSIVHNVPSDSAWGTGHSCLKVLPNDILDLSKLKALANNKRNAYQKYKFGFNKEENSVGKGENAGYQIESTCIRKKEMQLKNTNLFL